MGVGFVAGMLVSVFSKTLVLLAGIGMVLIQVRTVQQPAPLFSLARVHLHSSNEDSVPRRVTHQAWLGC